MNETAPVDVVTSVEDLPWYQSSGGPMVSKTVKAIAGLTIPLLQGLGLKVGIPWLDSLIDVLCIAGFGGYALYGYIQAKRALTAKIVTLQSQVKSLGAAPRA